MATPMTAAQWRAQLRKFDQPFVEKATFANPDSGRDDETGKPFGPVYGGLLHHTGDDAPDSADSKVIASGRSDLPGPLAHGGCRDDGVIELFTTGRANHAGNGDADVLRAIQSENYGDYPPKPDVDSVDGNDCLYALEVYYSGLHAMTRPQYAAAVNFHAAYCDFHGWTSKSAIGHKEWTRRKIDPGFCDMAKFRRDVTARIKEVNAPPITSHTRWAIRTTGVYDDPNGTKLRDIPAGYEFQVIDGSGSGMNGWVETTHHNWVLGKDTTTRDPALPSRLSVMSWNVKAGAARVDTVLAELKALTAEHQPDVVALQECYNLPRFGDAFPGYSFSYQAAGEAKTEGYVSEYPANVMLVRDGVEVKVQAPLEMTESWKGPKVGAMHDPRIDRRVTVLKDGVIWRVIDMHVPPPVSGGENNDAIAESNAAMVECLTEFPADEPVIIVGDMNQDNATVVRRVGVPGGAAVDGGGVDLAVFRDCTKVKGENFGLHTSDHPAKQWEFEA